MLNKKILDRDKLYLVAISGGADSVALLMMMLDEGYRVEAVHCNFHLRGEEADRDEAFVAGLCERFGVALHRVHFDTRGYAALHKLSIETAARDLRYGYFERLREDIGAEAIVVAHHRDDNVETVLMNLVRGTGLKGLAGIRPVNGRVIRPLLDMTREDIEAYIYKRGESFVTDSTNLETDATRNKYRLEVIPALKEINPSVARAIDTTARHLQDADEIVEWALEKMKADVMEEGDDGVVRIDTTLLRQLPAPRYVLFEICRQYGFLPQQSNVVWAMMEHGEKGKTVASTEYEMASEHNLLLVARKEEMPQPVRMPIEGLYVMNGRRLRIELKKGGLSRRKDSDVSSRGPPVEKRRPLRSVWYAWNKTGKRLSYRLQTKLFPTSPTTGGGRRYRTHRMARGRENEREMQSGGENRDCDSVNNGIKKN